MFYLSKKLQDYVGARALDSRNDQDIFTWYVTMDDIDWMTYFVFSNTLTGYSIFLFIQDPLDKDQLFDHFISGLRESLLYEGIKEEGVNYYCRALKYDYAKTNNRKIIGRTNVKHNDMVIGLDSLDVSRVNQKILNNKVNRIPFNNGENPLEQMMREFKTQWDVHPVYKGYVIDITIDLEIDIVERQVVVPVQSTLGDLHGIIQKVFGWTDQHLHEFIDHASNTSYTVLEDFMEDDLYNAKAVSVKEAFKTGAKWTYIYDMGDYWQHTITVGDVYESSKPFPPFCTKARGENIPENIGGVGGYQEYMHAIEDAQHPEHTMYKDMLKANDYRPFDMQIVNDRLSYML